MKIKLEYNYHRAQGTPSSVQTQGSEQQGNQKINIFQASNFQEHSIVPCRVGHLNPRYNVNDSTNIAHKVSICIQIGIFD